MPFGRGVAGALGDRARVPPVCRGAGRGDDSAVSGPVEGSGVGGEFGVDGGPFRRGQARGFPHEEGRAPLVDLPGLQIATNPGAQYGEEWPHERCRRFH